MDLDLTQVALSILSLLGAIGTAWFGWKSTREQKSDSIWDQNCELILLNTHLRKALTRVDNETLLWKLSMRKQLRQLTEDAISQVQAMPDLSADQKSRVWTLLHKNRETLAKSFDGKFPDISQYIIDAVIAVDPSINKKS